MSSDEEVCDKECPLCVEPLELDDLNFYPCKCEYQICRFCWHRIRTDANGLCPGCRQPYPEDPVNFKPLSTEELQRIKNKKKVKQQLQKQKMSENRKHLANLRVLQDNLVYVIGLSPRIADAETLKKQEYFGKFGKIKKVAVGNVGSGAQQSGSSTAYVTYVKSEEALRAIQSVNNVCVDGKTVRASLGTTKYCSAYLRNQSCHKPECMYLHELAKEEASFTKEDMQMGKHSDYEKKLHDQLLLQMTRRQDGSSPKENSGEMTGEEKSGEDSAQTLRHSSRSLHSSSPTSRTRESRSLERRPVGSTLLGGSTQDLARPVMEFTNSAHPPPYLTTQNSGPPLDVQGRLSLIAAMQMGGNSQSLFSQDDAGLITRAKAAVNSQGGTLNHSSQSTTNLASSAGSTSLVTALLSSGAPPGFRSSDDNNRPNGQFFLTDPNGVDENGRSRPVSWSPSVSASLSMGNLNSGAGNSQPYPEPKDDGGNTFLQRIQESSALNKAKNNGTPSSGPGADDTAVILSGEPLSMSSAMDWQAAFGVKSQPQMVQRPPGASSAAVASSLESSNFSASTTPLGASSVGSGPVIDDDLDFDPFSESSKGLIDLLKEEELEKAAAKAKLLDEEARRRRQQQQELLALKQHNGMLQNGHRMNHQAFSASVSPPTFSSGFRPPKSGPASFGDSFSLRPPPASGSSPIPFTTPPPGFPGPFDSKMYQNGPPPMPPGSGFNGIRAPPPPHSMPQNGPLPPFPGYHYGREHSPSNGPPPSVSPHGGPPPGLGPDPFNLSEWQEGLRSLFPNVNVRFSPNLQHKGSGGNWNPGGPRPPPPHHHGPPPPFINQPPPPLSVATNGGMGPPMRPSPPGDHFSMPPPHFPPGPPRGPPGSGVLPPPGFSGPGAWNSLTPPPPGYSPRQQQSL